MTTAQAADARQILSYVRRCGRENQRRRLSDRLIDAYMRFFLAGYAVLVVQGLVDTDLEARPDLFLDITIWMPVVLLSVVWGVLRFATWQGPVLFTAPEMQWIVSSPTRRRDLILIRMARALTISGVAGAAGGLAIATTATVISGDAVFGVFAAATVGGAVLAVLATAVSWHVERSPKGSLVVRRLFPLFIALLCLLVWAAASGKHASLYWSGPWGWATAPVVAQFGGEAPGWFVQAALLGASALVGLVALWKTAAKVSDEELWRRAEARSVAAASMRLGDMRTALGVARRTRSRALVRQRGARLRPLRFRSLLIPSRDLLTIRRNPGIIAGAAFFAAGALTAAIAAAERPLLAIGAVLGLYLAAARLLEPIRSEALQAEAHRMLPWPWGQVLVMHCIVPTAILGSLGWIGAAVAVAVGGAPAAAFWPLMLVIPFAAAAIVTPTAISVSRRPFPMEMLITQEERGAFVLFAWLVTGPLLVAIVVNIGFGLLLDSIDNGLSGGTLGAVGFFVLAATASSAWLWTRSPKAE